MHDEAVQRGGRSSLWLTLFVVLLVNLAASMLLLLAANTLWSDVNGYISDAIGLAANWVLLFNALTVVLLANCVCQIVFIARRRSSGGRTIPRRYQKILYFPVLVFWNALMVLLLVQAWDGVLVAQLVYHYQLLAPWVCLLLFLLFGLLLARGLARRGERRGSVGRLLTSAALAIFFLAASLQQFASSGHGAAATARSVAPGQFFDEQILFDATDDPTYVTFRIPGLVITRAGVIVAYCEAREGFSDWANMDIVMRRSVDGGVTWGERVVLAASGKGTVHNPVMIAESGSETIHFLYNVDYEKAFYARSRDAGATWSQPVDITATFDEFERDYDGKVIAIGPGHGIQLRSGRLLAPVWLSRGQGNDGHHPAVVATIYSDDGGRTWQRGEIVGDVEGPTADETTAVELSDGSVMLNMRNEDYSLGQVYRAVSVSPDGATGWSTPRLDEQLPDPLCFGSLHRYDERTLLFSSIHTRLETGFALRYLNMWGPREPLGIRVSFDDGQSWPIAKIYQEDEAGYSDINVRDGIIYSLYEQGWENENKYRTLYLKLVRFDLDWITDGR